MAVFRVGPTRAISSIMEAYYIVDNGDTLFIDEGEYPELLHFENKVVNLIGNTNFPEEGRILINPLSRSSLGSVKYDVPLKIKYPAANPAITMLVEGIKFIGDPDTWTYSLVYFSDNEPGDLSLLNLIFNRCILDAEINGVRYRVIEYANSSNRSVNSITFKNCDILWRSNDAFGAADWPAIPTKVFNKSVVNRTPETSFNVKDYIYTYQEENVVGYGPKYGKTMVENLPKQYCISGTVSVNDVPSSREIRIFNHSSDAYIGSTVSSGTTGEYYFGMPFGGLHYLICLDDVANPNYNDLIMSKISPENLSEYIFTPLTVVNPGAETGDMTGWTSELGGIEIRQSGYESSNYFSGGNYAESIVSQRIDLIAQGIDTDIIDTASDAYVFYLSAMTKVHNQSPTDQCFLGLRYLDASQTIIDTDMYSPAFNSITWQSRGIMQTVVSGTRYVDILMKGFRRTGTYCNSDFDNLKLGLLYLQ